MTDIRPLTPADEADWCRLWTAYLAFYETTVPEAVYAETFRRLLDPGPWEPWGLIARRDGAAVGLVHVIPHRHCWREANSLYLQDLFVDPAARGTGLGRALIEAVYSEADRQGAGSVHWLTAEDNAAARRLYDRIAAKTPFVQYKR